MGREMGESLGAHGPDSPICIVYSHRLFFFWDQLQGEACHLRLSSDSGVLSLHGPCTSSIHQTQTCLSLHPDTQWQWRQRMTPWAGNGFRDTTDGVLLSWQLWRNENSRLPSVCPSQPSVYQEWSAVGISLGRRTQSPHWMSFWILSFAFVLSLVRNWGKG